MRLEYMLATVILAGCAGQSNISGSGEPSQPAYVEPRLRDAPKPYASLRSQGNLTLSPEQIFEIELGDAAQYRCVKKVSAYLVAEGGKNGTVLNISGSLTQLELDGKASFFITLPGDFSKFEAGEATLVIDVKGKGTGTCKIPVVVCR